MTDTYYLQTPEHGRWVNSAVDRSVSDPLEPLERLQAKARQFDRKWGRVRPWRIITWVEGPLEYTVHWRNGLAITLDEAQQ